MSAVLLAFVILSITQINAFDWDVVSDLDEYVNRPEDVYDWSVIEIIDYPDYSIHILNMTSLQWMDETYVNETIWWHYLTVFIPKTPIIRDAAYYVIGGGNWDDNPPTPDSGSDRESMKRMAQFTQKLGVVSGYIRMVPMQPAHFGGRVPRTEDLIIGHTWKLYIEADEGDDIPEMVVLLPMTKAAKKGVDTMIDYVKTIDASLEVTKIMPTGYSKRGWTTWLLGCVDRRVFAMAPTVYDLLNMQPNLEHHYRAYGGWSWAFSPYWVEDVSRYLYHPKIPEMELFMDPISFNERLTMPKLIIGATGDEFFLPDGSHYFFSGLTGPKFMQIWENDSHGMSGHLDQRDTNLQAFFLNSYRGLTFPQVDWTRSEDETSGTIHVWSDTTPVFVGCWWADTTNVTCERLGNNTCRRDFRMQTALGKSGIEWDRCEVVQVGVNEYSVTLDKRDDFGFRGFFLELLFPGPDDYQMRFTTEVNIIPDEFPYPKCETEEQCRGRLV